MTINELLSEEDKQLVKLRGPTHISVIDCLDCGRVLAYKYKCSKCGSASWLPAGYINRMTIRRLLQEEIDERVYRIPIN